MDNAHVKREPTAAEKKIIQKLNVAARRSSFDGFEFTIAAGRMEWFEGLLARNGLEFRVVAESKAWLEEEKQTFVEQIAEYFEYLVECIKDWFDHLIREYDEEDEPEGDTTEDDNVRYLVCGVGVEDLVKEDFEGVKVDEEINIVSYDIARDQHGLRMRAMQR